MPHRLEAASTKRDRAYGQTLTYSPKVFLPVTNLCRNVCSYCAFRRSPGQPGAQTMTRDQVLAALDQASALGCVEALLCLGDTPETGFPAYQRLLESWGFDSTVSYLEWIAQQAIERGLLPHTNAGILSSEAMARLRRCNVSLGLMLESNSDRLCEPGMPHHSAPDKRPALRRHMIAEAGRLMIPFTSGILVGFGETKGERVEAIDALAALHDQHGHLQEVIVQPFRAHAGTKMRAHPGAIDPDLLETIAMARMRLPASISIQSPPNLAPGVVEALIEAGINDFGGISPVTPDFINPGYPWPVIDALAARCAAQGKTLRPRLPVYERYRLEGGWIDERLIEPARQCALALEAA
jgi:FO synthase